MFCGMARLTAAWILLLSGILAAAATALFVALVVFTGPPHGPFTEVVIAGAVVALVLVLAAVRIRRRAALKQQ